MEILNGRIIYKGEVKGSVLMSESPIGFFGHVEPETGLIKEPGHPLNGQAIGDKILVFPHAKGSTVGSYILYALKKYGKAPAALILGNCELIVAVGSIISEIPTVDQVDIHKFKTGDYVIIEGDKITIERTNFS